MDRYERNWLMAVVATLGVFFASLIAGALAFGVRVPQPEGFINPLQLEASVFANPGLRDMGNNHYEAVILARTWAFTPAEIRVPVGAQVDFVMTSGDVTHGFIIEQHNVNFEVVPGHIARVPVTFDQAGEFHFICHEYCGRGHHLMYGLIIVEEATSETASAQ